MKCLSLVQSKDPDSRDSFSLSSFPSPGCEMTSVWLMVKKQGYSFHGRKTRDLPWSCTPKQRAAAQLPRGSPGSALFHSASHKPSDLQQGGCKEFPKSKWVCSELEGTVPEVPRLPALHISFPLRILWLSFFFFLKHSLAQETEEFVQTLDIFRFLESLSLVIPLPSESIRVHLIPLQISQEC